MTTCLGKSCSFGLPRVLFVNCCQFMYLVISLCTVLRTGCGVWLYQFLIIAYLFTFLYAKCQCQWLVGSEENILFTFMHYCYVFVISEWLTCGELRLSVVKLSKCCKMIPLNNDMQHDMYILQISIWLTKPLTGAEHWLCERDFLSMSREVKVQYETASEEILDVDGRPSNFPMQI